MRPTLTPITPADCPPQPPKGLAPESLLAGGSLAPDARVRRVVEFLESNFHRELSLGAMARVVGLSSSRLRHMFKAHTGTTPTRFLKNLRMQEAKRLLETTGLSVKEVMAGVGVSDPSNFTRDFRRTHGLTPTRIRNLSKLLSLPPLLWLQGAVCAVAGYVSAVPLA